MWALGLKESCQAIVRSEAGGSRRKREIRGVRSSPRAVKRWGAQMDSERKQSASRYQAESFAFFGKQAVRLGEKSAAILGTETALEFALRL